MSSYLATIIPSTYIGSYKRLPKRDPCKPTTNHLAILSEHDIEIVGGPLPGLVRNAFNIWYFEPFSLLSCNVPFGTHLAPVRWMSSICRFSSFFTFLAGVPYSSSESDWLSSSDFGIIDASPP